MLQIGHSATSLDCSDCSTFRHKMIHVYDPPRALALRHKLERSGDSKRVVNGLVLKLVLA